VPMDMSPVQAGPSQIHLPAADPGDSEPDDAGDAVSDGTGSADTIDDGATEDQVETSNSDIDHAGGE